MALKFKQLKDLTDLPFDDIIDVRSPSEFAEDHIPGAISLPVLSDEERAVVGTIYVQEDRFKARRVGATLVARNAADHIDQQLSDRDGSWKPLVYCWRGGQRSGSFTSILQQIGWRAEVLEGGYKSYRRLVVKQVYDTELDHRIILLDGNTGTAKTDILTALKEAGAQTIDLEGMARHRGSLLGGMGEEQPSQKMFEGQVAMALAKADPAKPVFVEAESNKIGKRIIPPSMWQAMINAPRITIEASLEARTDYLMRSYVDLIEDRSALIERLDWLRPIRSGEMIDAWCKAVEAGEFETVVRELMTEHYDPSYAKSYARRERRELGTVKLPDLDPQTLRENAVPQVLRLAGL